MKNIKGNQWKHTTAKSILDIPERTQKIEIFDDEFPNQISLYFSDGKGLRWPIRSISTLHEKHYQDVLHSWAAQCPLIDSRTDQSKPLPQG